MLQNSDLFQYYESFYREKCVEIFSHLLVIVNSFGAFDEGVNRA